MVGTGLVGAIWATVEAMTTSLFIICQPQYVTTTTTTTATTTTTTRNDDDNLFQLRPRKERRVARAARRLRR